MQRRTCRKQRRHRSQTERQRREVKMARLNSQRVRCMLLTFAGLALVMMTAGEPAQAQQKPDAQLEQAVTEYKSNLGRLLTLNEGDSKRAEERLTQMREL